ncbi:ABC transporter permease [Chondromyces crocatus]|uniref:ABC transporter permease n=1 Tax=Chondromyces crocatus TaxID=52 RepID=UPI0012E1B025|nr:ABC transporter permease [Chondromyces crocatus]
MRFWLHQLRHAPNPIWLREMKQSVRLTRTPVFMTVLTVVLTLLIAFIGGVASTETSPAKTGVVLFHVFFSLAYLIVTLVGPAVAANSIAAEREGRTWEAVVLTGIPPADIARGKFLAAYTSMGMYIVMMAPVGALLFLFGGVTALEVIVAFALLFLIALVSVALGLAISSQMSNLRGAILLTLFCAACLASAAFVMGGPLLSVAVHEVWPGIIRGAPIWLPAAYERATFGLSYVLFLIVLPFLAIALPAWFLYEVTIANLSDPSDDRSSGVKRWFLVAMPLLTATAALPVSIVDVHDRVPAHFISMGAMVVFLSWATFLFASEPIGPSRRVLADWERSRASAFRRYLGPGVERTAFLLASLGIIALLMLTALGLIVLNDPAITSHEHHLQRLVCFASYAISFYLFMVGLAAFLRARSTTTIVVRLMLFSLLFGIAVGPWIFVAIASVISEARGDLTGAMAVGAPSPFYVFLMMARVGEADSEILMMAGAAAMLGWVTLGLALLVGARARCRQLLTAQAAIVAQTDEIVRAEDEQLSAAP